MSASSDYATPKPKRLRVLQESAAAKKPESPGRMITIPASPFLQRIGYGTGVNVYLMERSPRQGCYRSPWAVKKVAKRFAKDSFGKRLVAEAEILRSLNHPNIVGYRTFKKAADGQPCLVMEKGEHSLMDLIEERIDGGEGPFTPKQILIVGLDVARALDYLHREKCLLHGDLKSGNVLIFGEFEKAKLCDFGVALPLEKPEGKVKKGSYYIGTEAWTAPEVLEDENGSATAKADIFSYGLTLWEMLALSTPHADKLESEDSELDSDDSGTSENLSDDAYQAALGTRPDLPELLAEHDYTTAVQVFVACTEELPEGRPSAKELTEMWE